MKNALYVDCLPIIHHWVKDESRIQQEKMAPFKNQHKMREHKKGFLPLLWYMLSVLDAGVEILCRIYFFLFRRFFFVLLTKQTTAHNPIFMILYVDVHLKHNNCGFSVKLLLVKRRGLEGFYSSYVILFLISTQPNKRMK